MAEWIDTSEAQQLSGYSIYHLRHLLREKKILGKKKGGAYWIDKASLDAYLAEAARSGDARTGPKSSPSQATS